MLSEVARKIGALWSFAVLDRGGFKGLDFFATTKPRSVFTCWIDQPAFSSAPDLVVARSESACVYVARLFPPEAEDPAARRIWF